MKNIIMTLLLIITSGVSQTKKNPIDKSIEFIDVYKNQLSERGFTIGGSYEAGFSKNTHGGIDTDGASNKQRLTLNLSLSLDKLIGLEGGTVFFQYQNHHGSFATDEVGDIQQFDGLDDPEYNRIHMFWYEQWLFGKKARFKIGKVEPKSEFFGPIYAKNHLGFSTERSPTIGHGPPANSVNLFLYPTKSLEFGFGIYDAAFNEGRDENDFRLHSLFSSPADTFYLAEGRYKWDSGRFMAGYWYLDGDFNKLDGPGTQSSKDGFYLVLDQMVYKENNNKDDNQGIGIYLQYGYTDEDISSIKAHYGAGFQWTGAIPSRDEDVWGMGVSHVDLSSDNTTFRDNYERAFEVFYKGKISKNLTLQYDMQFIENPSGQHTDALVHNLRVTFSF